MNSEESNYERDETITGEPLMEEPQSEHSMMRPSEETAPVKISVSEVLGLLEKGYTRTNKTRMYNPEIGSIAEYYDLSDAQVTEMFKHPKLSGKRTKKVLSRSFELMDDTNENNS